MAWIQVHQQLKDHRKLLAAADELEIEPAHMLGLLISFWLWALDNAPCGSLQGISNRMIARAAQWGKDPDDFVAAMTHAGLLDEESDGSLALHDWYEYTGKLIDQREAEKNRSRRRRAAAADSDGSDRRTTAGQTEEQPPDDRKKTAGRVDQTRLNQSRQDQSTPDQSTPDQGDLPPNPPPEPKQDVQERRFTEFWQQYPKRVGKKAAFNSWKKIKPDADLFERIMQAVELAKASTEWQRENGRYIPHPATWLNQGRWDDELTPGTAQQATGRNGGKANTMGVLAGIIADEEGGGLI